MMADKTQMIKPSPVRIRVEQADRSQMEYAFTKTFRVGREENCDLPVPHPLVSRSHLEIYFESGQWWGRDLDSSNGTFIDAHRVERFKLSDNQRISLGEGGPELVVNLEDVSQTDKTKKTGDPSLNQYIEHYFTSTDDENIGEHTRFIRSAFLQVQKKHTNKYLKIIGIVGFLFVVAGVYGFLQHQKVKKQRALAENIFYNMKSLELQLANLQNLVKQTGDAHALAEAKKTRASRQEMQKSYNQFVKELGIYTQKMSEEDRIIFRMARIFGECEVNMPDGFVQEVRKYINRWKTTDRLEKAIQRAETNDYNSIIGKDFLDHDLPPQFFYLALQESDFKQTACGPKTRFGIAKGIWQFIPSTAIYYGLHTGPLVDIRRPDPRDDRYHMDKATVAAAKYIRDMYETEAQASGLLVIASYNWGHTNVKNLIQTMPQNPRDRNFWKLLALYKDKIPQETYDYVFYIISAAVIGENPRLFGFDFDNPLKQVEEKLNG